MTAWDEIWTSTKQGLDNVSPSMCFAKWRQITLHLQTGLVHSCHHPIPHKASALEVMVDPSALVNTQHLKKARQQMLDGHRPPECEHCWNIEDNSSEASDRIQKSAAPWAWEGHATLTDTTATPTYLEVDLGSTCNMKCMYCSPEVSSMWMEEIKRDGLYPLTHYGLHNLEWMQSKGRVPIPENNPNPYLEAFWKWFPDVFPTLHTLRITGGEPLLNPGLWKMLKMIDENPRPDLNLAINTNLMVPNNVWDRFEQWLEKIVDKVKTLEIYTSADTYGEDAQYIRHGFNWNVWVYNVWNLLTHHPKIIPIVTCTFNALSIPSFDKFLEWMHRAKMNPSPRVYPLYLDFTYLRHPEFQTSRILYDVHKSLMEYLYQYIQNHMRLDHSDGGFEEMELTRFKAVMDWTNTAPEYLDTLRSDFYLFFMEHDRRRDTNFVSRFPLYSEFWKTCQESHAKLRH